jgi:hypothetical protein
MIELCQMNARVLVTHTCNPCYSGSRDQEDRSLKPVWSNSSQEPISKIPITKKTNRVAQSEGPEFKPQYHTHTHTHTHKRIMSDEVGDPGCLTFVFTNGEEQIFLGLNNTKLLFPVQIRENTAKVYFRE